MANARLKIKKLNDSTNLMNLRNNNLVIKTICSYEDFNIVE